MKGKKILIIGGSGFLGKKIMKAFDKDQVTYYYADLNPVKGMESNFISLNVLNKEDFNKLDSDFTTIINLTGQVSNPSNLCFELNTKGIHNITNYVRDKNAELIQVSTISVYGSSESKINEESKLNPETSYGTCKATAEYLIQKDLSKNQYIILRLSNLYGDDQPKGIIAYLLRSVKEQKDVTFNNNGNLKRHYLNVLDASNMIVTMCKNFKSGIYNYVGYDVYNIHQLVSVFKKFSGDNFAASFEDRKPWENISEIDSTKIETTYKIHQKMNLESWLIKQLIVK